MELSSKALFSRNLSKNCWKFKFSIEFNQSFENFLKYFPNVCFFVKICTVLTFLKHSLK